MVNKYSLVSGLVVLEKVLKRASAVDEEYLESSIKRGRVTLLYC
jgi:hypothetical protein